MMAPTEDFWNLQSRFRGKKEFNFYDKYVPQPFMTTPTPSITPTITITPYLTPTPTASITPTITPSITSTQTPTPSITPTITNTTTQTPTPSITPTITVTPYLTPTPTITPTITPTENTFVFSAVTCCECSEVTINSILIQADATIGYELQVGTSFTLGAFSGLECYMVIVAINLSTGLSPIYTLAQVGGLLDISNDGCDNESGNIWDGSKCNDVIFQGCTTNNYYGVDCEASLEDILPQVLVGEVVESDAFEIYGDYCVTRVIYNDFSTNVQIVSGDTFSIVTDCSSSGCIPPTPTPTPTQTPTPSPI